MGLLRSDAPVETMQKIKSPSPAQRIFPKRWRKSGKSSAASGAAKRATCMWTPEGAWTWSSVSGRRVVLTPTSLLTLSECERQVLQKLALAKLQALELGCPSSLPKDGSKKGSKRSAFSLKRKTNSDPAGSGWVFGIPIAKCLANDIELRRHRPSSLRERTESTDTHQTHRSTRKSSSSSTGGLSSDSFSESGDSKSTDRGAGSNLLDALSLSTSAKFSTSKVESSWRGRHDSLTPHTPHVPYIVNTCCKHLETYGIRVLGIFRIGNSKKRVKQLRDEFDTGKDVKLNEEHSPHDVGGLLKDYFRELPDPLLTRDLYTAFVNTTKIKSLEKRLHALHLLVAVLPVANRDTLYALLKFLKYVVKHSTDTIDEQGQTLPGNKMDAHNLATLFGPNILHKAKGGEYEVETVERAEERREVIAVTKELIEHCTSIFELSPSLHDEVLRVLQDSNVDALDYLLKRKSSSLGLEVDAETSSSFYEESDSSSIPRSPSYSSETDGMSHPRTLSDALALHQRAGSLSSTSNSPKVRSADPPATVETLKVPQFRIISPEQGWYRPDSRSPSPVSPRISPSPKAMKSATPDLRTRFLFDIPDRSRMSSPPTGQQHQSSIAKALVSPQPGRFRKQFAALGPVIPQYGQQTLAVPPPSRRDGSTDSNSSMSSCHQSSSQSNTNSPVTPDVPPSPQWYKDSPPTSPSHHNAHARARTNSEHQRTSSQHRPLGINAPFSRPPPSPSIKRHSGPPQVGTGTEWQKERWRHWERLAKEHSEEYHEQETLV